MRLVVEQCGVVVRWAAVVWTSSAVWQALFSETVELRRGAMTEAGMDVHKTLVSFWSKLKGPN